MKRYIFNHNGNEKSLHDLFAIDQYSGGTVEHLEQYVEKLMALNVSLLSILLESGILSGDDINEIASNTMGYELGKIQDVNIIENSELDDPNDRELQGNDDFEYIDGKWRLKR